MHSVTSAAHNFHPNLQLMVEKSHLQEINLVWEEWERDIHRCLCEILESESEEIVLLRDEMYSCVTVLVFDCLCALT